MVPHAKSLLPCVPLLLCVAGCGLSARANPVRAAMASHRSPSSQQSAVVFRFSAERGGDARLYVLPRLNEATWRFRVPGFGLGQIVGFSHDAGDIYLFSATGDLMSLDLVTGRARVIDSTIAAAAVGPTGTLHFARADGSVGAIDYRSVTGWPVKLEHEPAGVWGGTGERFVALEGDTTGRELVTLSANAPPVRQRIPDGPLTVSPWGDLAVVAADSGLFLLDPADAGLQRFRRLAERPDAVAFSPSEHRLYVALASGTLVVLDRYSSALERVDKLSLPGRARALRMDPLGRILLVQPVTGDSIWLVDLPQRQVMGTLAGTWRPDLPAVAADGTILVADGQDIVAHFGDSLGVAGRVRGGAPDRWFMAAWDPRRPLQLAAEAAAPAAPAAQGEQIYVQVSSTANQSWAEDNARSLRAAGMQAGVLPPSPDEDRYRVVLGPYPTRDAAEAIGRKLGRPFWIFTRAEQDQPR